MWLSKFLVVQAWSGTRRADVTWCRARLTTRGDPGGPRVLATLWRRIVGLPRGSVVLAGGETHLRRHRDYGPHGPCTAPVTGGCPVTSRRRTLSGVLDLATGAGHQALERRSATECIAALTGQALQWYGPEPGK